MRTAPRWVRRVQRSAIGVALLSCCAQAARPQDVPVLHPGDTVSGEIADGDAEVRTAALDGYSEEPTVGRPFRIEVGDAGTYRIELRSCFFDAYLVVRDAAGNVLTEDDDGLIATHSTVTLEMRPGAALRVEACALHGTRGSFELAVLPGAPEPLEPGERQAASIEEARRCLAALESAPGVEPADLASSLHSLARLLHAMGDLAAARPPFERSLAIRERTLGPEHPDVATSLHGLARLHRDLGDLAAARPLFERSLAIDETTWGPEHPVVATSLHSLARLLQDLGDPAGARPLFERSLAIRERALGPEHRDVATSLMGLALALQALGDFTGARPLLERSLAIDEKALGPAHPDVASSLNHLATLLRETGDYAGARPLFERSLAIREQALGPGHLDVAQSANNLALLLQDLGEYAAARPLLERSLAIDEQALGPDHPDVATSLNNLALLLQVMGDCARARPLFERSLAIREKALGPGHPEVATSLNNLALLMHILGDDAAARPLLERSRAIRESALGPEHPDVASSLMSLGVVLQAGGDFADARPLFERSRAIYERALGPEHSYVAASLHNLAGLHHAMGDSAGARPLYEQALAIEERALGPEHPNVATTLHNLAALLQAMGDFAGARPLLERALAIDEAALGPEHPDVAMSLNRLGLLALDQGDPATALAYARRVEAVRSGFLSRYLSVSSEADALVYTDSVRSMTELSQSSGLRGVSPTSSYEELLSWKGQVLRAARARQEQLRAALRPEARALAGRLAELSSALSRSATAVGGVDEPLDAAVLKALSEEYQRVQRELAPLLAGLQPPVPAWSTLRAALPADAALVDLFVHRDYEPARLDGATLVATGRWTAPVVTAWVSRPDATEPLAVDLGPSAAIEDAIGELLDSLSITRGVAVAPREDPGLALARLVWAPLRPHLDGIDTVIVSPDGVLATLPFEILRGDDGRYLVEERRFVYLTDPTDLVRLGPTRPTPASSLLSIGGVDYKQAAETDPSETEETPPSGAIAAAQAAAPHSGLPRGGWTDVWEQLPRSQAEASRIIARHEQANPVATRELLIGPAATEEAIKRELPGRSVVHFATHGYCNPEGLPSLQEAVRAESDRRRAQPLTGDSLASVAHRLEGHSPGLLSGLVCAGANTNPQPPRDDGYLTAEEVGWLDLSGCDLVVLSACDTGLGRPQSGEGLLGLRRAFLSAGARTVISSLWSVLDQETAELMDLFYRNLWQRGMGKHESLRAAQLEIIARQRARHDGDARPVTWGAFVVDGDWR